MLLWWICRTVSFRAGLGPVFGRVFRQKGARALPFVRAFPAPDNVPVNLPFFVSVWFGPAKFAMFLSGMGGTPGNSCSNKMYMLARHLRGGLGIVWVHSADHISYRMLWTCQDPSETESWLEPPKLAREIRRPIANVSLGRQRNFVNRLGGSVR